MILELSYNAWYLFISVRKAISLPTNHSHLLFSSVVGHVDIPDAPPAASARQFNAVFDTRLSHYARVKSSARNSNFEIKFFCLLWVGTGTRMVSKVVWSLLRWKIDLVYLIRMIQITEIGRKSRGVGRKFATASCLVGVRSVRQRSSPLVRQPTEWWCTYGSMSLPANISLHNLTGLQLSRIACSLFVRTCFRNCSK